MVGAGIAASIPARCSGRARAGPCSISARRRAARRCSSPPPAGTVTAVDISESRLARLSENLARTRLEAEIVAGDVMKWQPRRAGRRDPARRALLGDRHLPPPSRRAPPRPPRAIAEMARGPEGDAGARRRLAEARRNPGLCGLLARTRGRRGGRRRLPRRAATIIALEERAAHPPGACRAEGGADGFFIARFVAIRTRSNKRGISRAASLPRESRAC